MGEAGVLGNGLVEVVLAKGLVGTGLARGGNEDGDRG